MDARISNPPVGAHLSYTSNTGQYLPTTTTGVPLSSSKYFYIDVDNVARTTLNYANSNLNVQPAANTASGYYNAGQAGAANVSQRFSNLPQTQPGFVTQNSYANPLNINTAATGMLNKDLGTINTNIPPTNTSFNPQGSYQQNPSRQTSQNVNVPTGNQVQSGYNTIGKPAPTASAPGASNWKTYALIGLGLLALTGIILGLLFGLGVLGGKSRDLDYKPADTTVTSETIVIDKSNSTTTPTTPTTTTNGTVSPTPTPTKNTTTSTTPTSNTGTNTTNFGSGTTSPTSPSSGTSSPGTTFTFPSGTPTYTYVYPKHHLQRKFVD